jgi:hypothetical protein
MAELRFCNIRSKKFSGSPRPSAINGPDQPLETQLRATTNEINETQGERGKL